MRHGKKIYKYLLGFLEPRFWVFRHLLYWIYSYSNYIFDWLGFAHGYLPDNNYYLFGWMGSNMALVYLFFFVFIPFLWNRKRMFAFSAAAVVSFVCYIVFSQWITDTFAAEPEHDPLVVTYFQYFANIIELLLPALSLRFLVTYLYDFERNQEQKNEKLKTELAYLKNQINPHFLFNTLNNIAVLADLYPERVTPTIIELSNVLRYQLYESEKNAVLLTHEIENLRQNLNLEAMRLNEVKAHIEVEGNVSGIEVAPLLFLPFLENAMKHSANPSGIATIEILFKMENEKTLVFTARNSKPPVKPKQIEGGLGLKNIQRRLELIYPQKHELNISDSKDWYFVSLKIKL